MSWDPITSPVDYFKLGGQKSPGLADISGASSPRKWDERKGYGLSGATVIFRGIGLSKFSARIRLYTAQDWADWETFRPLVDRPPVGTRPRALDIWHPLLEGLAIKSVVVEDVGQADQTDDGEWTIEIKFLEFRRPKLALSKPEGSAATPVDPYDQKIDQLTKQFKDLANE